MGLFDQLIVKTLPLVPKPIVRYLSKPYIAGAALEDALACIQDLNQKGFRTTVDILGEFVTDFNQVEEAFQGYLEVVKMIDTHKLDANISIKPTSFGLLLDQDRCRGILHQLLEEVVNIDNFMRIDMEDSPCTTMTIDMYHAFRQEFGQKVGVVLQAYLHRTQQDIGEITAKGKSHFRLCKGIYVEPESKAIKDYEGIRRNYLDCLKLMFDKGAFVGIATHDDYLVQEAQNIIAERGLGPEHYEFQMLLGVREPLRDQIKQAGHNVRIYVPFGADWYGYSVRRLKENPALAGTMFKAIFLRQ